MTTPLTLTTTTDRQGRPVVKAVGEIDLSNTEAFAAALAGTTGPVVIDLTEVHYIDSAGMSVLFTHAERTELISSPLLRPILEMSGLTSMATVRRAEE
ncbi:STAS domain-containing protein [Nocardia sp. NRRL S-836]|uniref:STAS domain-containing protein n=1 Tax=Nocardia sp. NRRL S-836 TaxID=1519492 RepID=UPI0006AECD0D|nr:STAS domain-containing protein [Nocardia sp. NRRL S-836]KOV78210.1 anti-anti-sigma regulatory factor [Nocardia sp. NRRL S-836]